MNKLTKQQKQEALVFMAQNEGGDFAAIAHILSIRFKVDLRAEDCFSLMMDSQ